MTRLAIELRKRFTKKTVSACLHDELTGDNKMDISQFAKRSWLRSILTRAPADAAWDWERKLSRAIWARAVEVWVIECDQTPGSGQSKTQGLVIFEFALSPLRSGATVAIVNLLGVPVHNRSMRLLGLTIPGQFRGVKIQLLMHAASMAARNGFANSVGLWSVPEAEASYRRFGFTVYPQYKDKHGNSYFEKAMA